MLILRWPVRTAFRRAQPPCPVSIVSHRKTHLESRNPPPPAPFPPLVAALLLLLTATVFASNHIAARLAFDHPETGASVEVQAPLPEDLVRALRLASGERAEESV